MPARDAGHGEEGVSGRAAAGVSAPAAGGSVVDPGVGSRSTGAALEQLGAVPRVLVWDRQAAVGRRRPPTAGANRGLPRVSRCAGREGDHLQTG
jgi:hypothetical protein